MLVKFVIGMFLVGVLYILIGIVGYVLGLLNFLVNWVILLYIICVIGELCLLLMGNSVVVKLVFKVFNV